MGYRSGGAESFNARLIYGAAVLVIIASGSALRLVPVGLPYFIVKYGGSTIWGAMVYVLVAFCAPVVRIRTALLTALSIATLSELFRLYQTPELDAFRRTLAGALLLGRVFSFWNIVAYSLGIVLAAAGDAAFRRAQVPLCGSRFFLHARNEGSRTIKGCDHHVRDDHQQEPRAELRERDHGPSLHLMRIKPCACYGADVFGKPDKQ